MEKSNQLQLIDEYAQWLKDRRDNMKWPLSYNNYKKRIETNIENSERFDVIDEYDSKLTFKSLSYEETLFEKDTILKEKRSRWHKSLTKDVYVDCLLYTSPSPRDATLSRMPSSA